MNSSIVDKDVDETEIKSSKVYLKNLKQKTEKKRTSTINCKQSERCDDVIVNELLDAQAATIGAWKLDNVIDQISVGKDSQTNSSRSSSSQVSNAIKGIPPILRSLK